MYMYICLVKIAVNSPKYSKCIRFIVFKFVAVDFANIILRGFLGGGSGVGWEVGVEVGGGGNQDISPVPAKQILRM